MKNLVALLAALPLAALAQPAEPAPAPAPPQYAPPPQHTPPAYAPPPQGAPPAAYAPPQKQRDTWYIGFGLGGGSGSLERGGDRLSHGEYLSMISGGDMDPVTVTLNFKVGATLSPRFLLGLDVNALRSAASDGGVDVAVQISNYDIVGTFFPTGKGFFLRGGAGLSRFTAEVEDDFGSGSEEDTGLNVIGGVGYAFWLGKQFNLTLNADFSQSSYGTSDLWFMPESARHASFWIGFDWY